MFAFSTSWNAWRHSSAASLVNEVLDLGFSSLELGFSLPLHIFEGVKSEVEKGRIQVTSLHDYCPRLNTRTSSRRRSRNDFFISSANEASRRSAVSAVLRTLQAAREVGASAIVVHSGIVPLWNSSRKVFGLMEARDDIRHPVLLRKLERVSKRREKRKALYFGQTLKSLAEIAEHASAYRIKVGVETRFYIEEIPSFEEISSILSAIDSPWLGYWHDVGHAQVKENLGMEKQEDYIGRYRGRLIGTHIHDVRRLRDHRAPLTGDIDFGRFKALLADQNLLKVFEVHPVATAEEIRRGRGFLETLVRQARQERSDG